MSTNIFNRDDGNKCLSYAEIDKDFDEYWKNEARNPVRNRIRIGRQYQATIQPMLKSNEIDKRNFEEREILKWTNKNELNEQQLEQYLQLAKAVSMFSRVVKSEVTTNNNSSSNETGNNDQKESESTKDDKTSDKNDGLNSDQDDQQTLDKLRLIMKSLFEFVNYHHPVIQSDSNCKLLKRTTKNESKYANSIDKKNDKPTDMLTDNSELSRQECLLFAAALQASDKNFSSIKNEFLPCKSNKNIIDYYQQCLKQNNLTKSVERQDNDQCDELTKSNELRNMLDARSVDLKLKDFSADMNNIVSDLIKASSTNDSSTIVKESDQKRSTSKNECQDDEGDSQPNSFHEKIINKSTSNVRSSGRTNTKSRTNLSSNDKKDQSEKKCKNFKSIDRRTSKTQMIKHNQRDNQMDDQSVSNDQSKIEPRDQYEFDDKLESADCSSLGSLKFYKDGQLVLKLNAKQPESNEKKCKWIESADSIQMNKLRRNYKKKKVNKKSKKPVEQNRTAKFTSEDRDDSSLESDDSGGSSNSSVQRSLTMNLFKKAKVKVENNYFVPLLSQSPSLNVKDDLESDLESNRKSISPLNNEDDLKRKIRTPNKNGKKKSVLKLNECTNQLNISSNLIEQLNSLSTTLKQSKQQSPDTLIEQINLLSNLPIDLARQLAPNSSQTKQNNLNNLNGLNELDLNTLNSLNSLSNLTNLLNNNQQQQNHDNLNRLLASFFQQQIQPSGANTFLENIDSIKLQNQIQSLMTNLNALIEAEHLK